ncbi:hypothetical protein D9M68_862820 [compost metagenome]
MRLDHGDAAPGPLRGAAGEEVGQAHAQRIGQPPQHRNGGVGQVAFDLRQHRLGYAGAARQFVERQALLLAQGLQRQADGRRTLCLRGLERGLRHGWMFVILRKTFDIQNLFDLSIES